MDSATSDRRVVVMNGKEFEIEAPDGLILLRVLKVVSRVLRKAEGEARAAGVALFRQAATALKADTAPEGEAKAKGEDAGMGELVQAATIFLMALDQDDLLKFASAVLQFPDESYGVRWLQKNGLRLAPLVQALLYNFEQLDDVIGALQVFTPSLSSLAVLRGAVEIAQVGVDSLTPSAN